MANNPSKMKDPTEAALSAIQEALNLRAGKPEDRSGSGAGSDAPASPAFEESFSANDLGARAA